MFLGSTEPELEVGFLRSERRFRSRKIRKTVGGRQNPSLFEEIEYKFESWLEEGYCNEEKYYSSIYEGAEEFKESAKTPKSECCYTTPGASPEVRYRTSSPERIVNTNSTSVATSVEGSFPSLNYSLNITDSNSMAGEDITLPTFNGNGV